ncbi:hypothetical protein H0H92_007601 [Tricholoma furcatifolium]|nr:hypothetical protein H0H92_007601 [Tricholoma furcatifolium]
MFSEQLSALPLWWQTTSIERLSLPHSRVTERAHHDLRIPVRIGLPINSDRQALQKSLNALMQEAPQRWEGLDVEIYETDTNDIRLRGSRSATFWTHTETDGSYIVHDSKEVAVVGRHLAFPTSSLSTLANTLGTLIAPPISNHRVVPYSPRYRLSFSLLNEDAAAGHSYLDWEISTMLHRHIQPILAQLNGLHNFTIESQVQFHAPLAFDPRATDNGLGINPEDLTVFVNSAEWTLSRRPLHILDHSGQSFLLSKDYTTLSLKAGAVSPSTSFLLPQWGSIVIFNPEENSADKKLASPSLDTIFSAFSDHLLALLGVPSLPSNLPTTSSRLTDWQLDALLRYRALSNTRDSQDTLNSIASLVNQIENMPVGQDVRSDVQGALTSLEEIFETSKSSLLNTFRLSAQAFTLSSRAFFNPGMLALLYFPAEHKYAVYTPMFASAVIPLFVAALREFASWRKQRRTEA